MTSTTTTTSNQLWSINWTCHDYDEIKWKRGQEPRKRRLRVVARFARSQWHITIAFEGSLHSDRVARAKIEKRRQDLENLCLCLDFDHLQLLDDTVTELLIKREHDTTPPSHQNDIAVPNHILPLKTTLRPDSEYYPVIAHLRLCVREDPFHVRFPPFDYSANIPTKDLLEISKTRQLSVGVHEARVTSNDKQYVYKEVDIPLYIPRDSQVLDRELRNLQLFHGTKAIVQLVAAVVSQNPYQTSQPAEAYGTAEATETIKVKSQTVLRGILLEYHPNGTLGDALQGAQDTLLSSKPNTAWPWRKWALQIACALAYLHEHGITHMDLKPSNVVISAEANAVLIDISGIGGITQEWLAPEMHHVSDPLSESMESRIRNDIWALGKLLSEMATVLCNNIEKKHLGRIALGATAEDPSSRTSIHDIISTLLLLSP
ncbi:kinase-like protein [Zopfia rhizophila CBS 207.26]|uniref:Kinase-like protein n=1 Tax=Zopfia rhizophila CBS 207.26 TaxID=1314779 RepID=A0A6A6ENQ5_9PEZI|nr:kinase-like protein [Zopfia rhizophila CBS 207.26]